MDITTNDCSVNDQTQKTFGAKNPNNLTNMERNEIYYIGTQTCCICFVDIVDSTRITSKLDDPEKIRKYYDIFLNSMAAIARSAGAKIIKSIGDSIVLCYPESSEKPDKPIIYDALNCCAIMIGAREKINRMLHEEGLPDMSYRISADYGKVEVAKSAISVENDLFGSMMNRCSRINLKAMPNGIAIGYGLYRALNSSTPYGNNEVDYYFEKIKLPQHEEEEFGNYPLYHLHKGSKLSSFTRVDIHEQQLATANILLVDDELDSLCTFKECLTSSGYKVEIFTDPLVALAHFANLNPSHYKLVILDIRMPGLNGLQLYSRLKAISRNIKILFVSALDGVPELTSILPVSTTTDAFIKKPVTIDNFLKAVKVALNK